jgi:tetratricopeptide (TPR) repeat protein
MELDGKMNYAERRRLKKWLARQEAANPDQGKLAQVRHYFELARQSELTGDYNKALAYITVAIKLDPDDFTGEKAQLIKELRGFKNDENNLHRLKHYVTIATDQAIQVAAIASLEKIGGREAILILFERCLDSWGMRSISRSITALAKLASEGGLLALSTILLTDDRFFSEKVIALYKGSVKMSDAELGRRLKFISDEASSYDDNKLVATVTALAALPAPDIQYGLILATHVNMLPKWANIITPINPSNLTEAKAYAEKQVPGLLNILEAKRKTTQF